MCPINQNNHIKTLKDNIRRSRFYPRFKILHVLWLIQTFNIIFSRLAFKNVVCIVVCISYAPSTPRRKRARKIEKYKQKLWKLNEKGKKKKQKGGFFLFFACDAYPIGLSPIGTEGVIYFVVIRNNAKKIFSDRLQRVIFCLVKNLKFP